MKKTILSILIGSTCFVACTKMDLPLPVQTEPCELQTANPTGKSYAADSVVKYNCISKHCGILPLSTKNYWVYEDSIFNYGVFVKVQYDTLQYTSKKSLTDGLTWWEGNLSVGLPDLLYANDSTFFGLEDRLFTPGYMDVKKDYSLFPGDSIKYLTSFEDAAAQGRSLKMENSLVTPAGTFANCLYFEKNARYYRKDQVYFKPGVGVIKYIQEKAPMGQRVIRLQQISTLVAIHFE